MILDLEAFVREYHPKGLVWKSWDQFKVGGEEEPEEEEEEEGEVDLKWREDGKKKRKNKNRKWVLTAFEAFGKCGRTIVIDIKEFQFYKIVKLPNWIRPWYNMRYTSIDSEIIPSSFLKKKLYRTYWNAYFSLYFEANVIADYYLSHMWYIENHVLHIYQEEDIIVWIPCLKIFQ